MARRAMKLSELLFLEGPPPFLEFRGKLEKTLRRAELPLDLELRALTREHLEALASISIEVLRPDERKQFFEILAKLLREEGNELYGVFEPKIIVERAENRRGFHEVISAVDLRSAELEADRCLRCRIPRCVNA